MFMYDDDDDDDHDDDDDDDDEEHDAAYFSGPHVCLICGRAQSGRVCNPLLRRAEKRRRAGER